MQRGNWYKADTSTDHASTDTSTDYVPTDTSTDHADADTSTDHADADTSTGHADADTSTDYVPTDHHAPAIRMQEANDDDNKYIDWVIIQLNKRCIYGCM